MTIYDDLRRRVTGDPSRPLLTFYDLRDGDRAELSAVSFDNAVAKAANLLVDGFDVTASTRVAIDLPLHWQLPVWVTACVATGCTAVINGEPGGCDVAVVGPDTVSAIASGMPTAPDTLAISLAPMGMPFATPLPRGVLDAGIEVRAYGDRFVPSTPPSSEATAIEYAGRRINHDEFATAAVDAAARWGLGDGGRLLTTNEVTGIDGVLAALPSALLVGGSVVMVAGFDPAQDTDHLVRLRDQEAITATAWRQSSDPA